MKYRLYTYWEGEMHPYLKICRDTILKNSKCEVIILGKKDVQEHKELPINLKVDYLKAKTIYKNGGFWIDADMIVLKDLRPLWEYLDQNDFVGIPGFFGANKSSKMLKRWIDGMDESLKNDKLTFSFDRIVRRT